MTTQTEEKTYKVTVYLVNGTKLKCHKPVAASDVLAVYRCLGNEGGDGRIKIPTAPDTMQYLPATSVLRIEAVGEFE